MMRANVHISAEQITEQLAITPRTVEKQIARLKELGKLKRIGAAKGGRWQVGTKKKGNC